MGACFTFNEDALTTLDDNQSTRFTLNYSDTNERERVSWMLDISERIWLSAISSLLQLQLLLLRKRIRFFSLSLSLCSPFLYGILFRRSRLDAALLRRLLSCSLSCARPRSSLSVIRFDGPKESGKVYVCYVASGDRKCVRRVIDTCKRRWI